jgi:hypothetical protein
MFYHTLPNAGKVAKGTFNIKISLHISLNIGVKVNVSGSLR